MDNVGKFGSYDSQGCEIKNETPVIAHTSSVREDVWTGTFNTSCGKDCINQGRAIPEGGGNMNASTLEACSLNMRSGWERRLEMRPEYTFSLKSPRRMISELVCFHTIYWSIICLKKNVWAIRKLPWASKYRSCCSCMVIPAELADLEPEGWYAITILIFLLPEPTVNQHQ